MELVVDTNILLSGLLRPSTTQRMLFSNELRLFAPEESLSEIGKHSNEFAERMGKTRKEFEVALVVILSNVHIVPKEEYASFKQKALLLCPAGHENDWPFIALAISLNCAIWSNDKALGKQTIVKVYSTHELIRVP